MSLVRNARYQIICLTLALAASTSSCDCLGKAVDQARSLATKDAGTTAAPSGTVDVTTRRRVELDLRKLRQEHSLSDFLGVYLKYHQILNARPMRCDGAMCKGGDSRLLESTRELAGTLLEHPKEALARVKDEMEAPPLHLAALLCRPELASLLLEPTEEAAQRCAPSLQALGS